MTIDYSKIKQLMQSEEKVVFAYLFGSFLNTKNPNDIDIAVYCLEDVMNNPFGFTSDLKISLADLYRFPPDKFDITLINALFSSDRIDSLIILVNIFDGILIIDKNPELRIKLTEEISFQFRESMGIINEIYS